MVAQRLHLQTLVNLDPRHLVVHHRDKQIVFVQHLVVLEVVQQSIGHAAGRRI